MPYEKVEVLRNYKGDFFASSSSLENIATRKWKPVEGRSFVVIKNKEPRVALNVPEYRLPKSEGGARIIRLHTLEDFLEYAKELLRETYFEDSFGFQERQYSDVSAALQIIETVFADFREEIEFSPKTPQELVEEYQLEMSFVDHNKWRIHPNSPSYTEKDYKDFGDIVDRRLYDLRFDSTDSNYPRVWLRLSKGQNSAAD